MIQIRVAHNTIFVQPMKKYSILEKAIMIQKMKRIISIIAVLITIQQTSFGQFEKYSFFYQIDSLWMGYMINNQMDSAILVFEYAKNKFPEQDKNITYTLGYLYASTKRDSLALAIWSYGQQKGQCFALNRYFNNEQFKNNEKFIVLAERDKQIGDSLDYLSHVEYEVQLPENYSNDRTYPLLFIFHGGGSSIKVSKNMWKSKTMNKSFITVYVQSYIIGFRYAYDWVLNDEKTNKEIRSVYNTIIDEYSVNKDKIYFLGYSAGGKIAIDYVFNDFVPVSGLVLCSPDVPNISDNSITEFVKKGKRLAIITGTKDWALNIQKELIGRINKTGGNSRIIIEEGIGHTYSKDFPSLLDESLTWINE
jgi:hypothetical protein